MIAVCFELEITTKPSLKQGHRDVTCLYLPVCMNQYILLEFKYLNINRKCLFWSNF